MLQDLFETDSLLGVCLKELGDQVLCNSRKGLGPLDLELQYVVEELILVCSLKGRRPGQ